MNLMPDLYVDTPRDLTLAASTLVIKQRYLLANQIDELRSMLFRHREEFLELARQMIDKEYGMDPPSRGLWGRIRYFFRRRRVRANFLSSLHKLYVHQEREKRRLIAIHSRQIEDLL